MNKNVDLYMPLRDGEKELDSVEGNAYNQSANIFERMFGFIIRIVSILTGTTKRVILTVTDNRVITVEINKVLWFLDGSVKSRSYAPRSVSSTGYELARSFIIFKSHYLEFSAGSQSYMIKAKGGHPKVMQVISQITSLAERVKS